MTFADELKSYLLQVQQGDMQVEPRLIELDTAWIRGVAIQLFEQLERQQGSDLSPEEFGKRFKAWMESPEQLWGLFPPAPLAERFAPRLSRLLQGSFLKGGSHRELEHYVRLGMALQIGVQEEVPSLSRRMELNRLAKIAASSEDTNKTVKTGWRNVAEYALEVRAIRKSGTRLELTPIGSVFLGLAGRDAIQWLLSVEVAQSTGPWDEWRLSRDAVSALLEQPESTWPFSQEERAPCSWSTLRRLSAMGLMSLLEDDPEAHANGYDGYALLETGLQALKALAEPAGTPFSVLAATLSNDEALATLSGLPGKQAGAVRFQASADATALQARLVAHEIRNALLPVQSALDSFYESVVGQQQEAQMGRLRPRIDSGIERVLSFVRELLRTSELATQPPEPFELARAIEEARASFPSHLSIQVTGASLGSAMVEGYRGRFVLALVNLLRNAEQAGARSVVLDLKEDEGGQGLLLTLDDDGSGVPAEQRERIFQTGVSLRGGTGVGLALVREVIESEMQGKVACQEAPEGGARFLMRLPLKERRSR